MGGRPRGYMSADGKALKESYILEAQSQWRRGLLPEPVRLNLTLYFKDKRRRDVDNYNKLVLDCLEGVVYEDDKQVQQLFITKAYDKENPRIEVEIIQL